MSAESPAEYIEKLKAENRALRRSLIEEVAKRQDLELQLARENAEKIRALNDLHSAWQFAGGHA